MIKGWDGVKCGLLAIIANAFQFAGPVFLKLILQYLEDKVADNELYIGYIWATALIFCLFIKTFCTQNCLQMINTLSMKILNGTSGLLIEKILRLSTPAKQYFESGKIMNFITVDQQMVFTYIQMITIFYFCPMMIIVSMGFIFYEVGWIGLITPVILIISLIFQKKMSNYIYTLRNSIMKWKDQRSKAVSEYFTGIKIVKYYAMENVVFNKIRQIRKNETQFLMNSQVWKTVIDLLVNQTPLLLSIITFTIYIQNGNDLKPSKAYSILSIFNLIMQPLRMLMFTVVIYMNSKSSQQRIDHFIESEEFDQENLVNKENLEKGQIIIENGEFGWENLRNLEHDQKGKLINFKAKNKNKQKLNELQQKNQEQILKFKQKNSIILENININVKPGQFIGVVGAVGSGKTSLIHSFLGEMQRIQGNVYKNGSVAYVPQQAWLRNATLKDNILFGNTYDQKLYQEVIKLCELQSDIDIMPGGDQIEIGEKGVNLSGGQKQRIGIARAIYSQSDIYLVDDCLSALDFQVSKSIFQNVFLKYLKQKTIVFVTHSLNLLPNFDKILIMDQGKIVEEGPYQNLIEDQSKIIFQGLLSNFNKKQKQESQDQDSSFDQQIFQDCDELLMNVQISNTKNLQKITKNKKNEVKSLEKVDVKQQQQKNQDYQQGDQQQNRKQGAMIKMEERAVGSVPWHVYVHYMVSGGKCTTFMVLFTLTLAQTSRIFCDWWIGKWIEDSYDLDDEYYIIIYFCLGLIVGILFYMRGLIFAKFTIKSADKCQEELILSLLHTPMYWFDTTPLGRIISRTTKDQDDIDSQLPQSLQTALQNILMLIGTLILISIILPLFLIVSLISSYIFYKAVSYYLISAREIKRIEALAKSPVISNFQEVISGITVIRAFNKQQFFIDKYMKEQHKYIVSFVNFNYTQRWISVQTDLFALFIIACTCYFAVLSKQFNYLDNPSLMGLSITWALQITSLLSFTLKMIADTESQMNALVRMLQYINENPEEQDWNTKDEKVKDQLQNWPTQGNVEIQEISYKYRDGLPNVIHNISVNIESHSKIGVVGRTGSGKSTLTLGLMRILEISQNQDKTQGRILIDGVDISKIGLHELRSQMTIIPQDPVLFSGTLRSNLDPLNKYSDGDIIKCLQQVQLWENLQILVQKNNNKLDNKSELQKQQQQILSEDLQILNLNIQDNGDNFSLGQKQMICLARALIRKPKILLMDEATASIDEKTDQILQNIIQTQFSDCTVITIAHRLNTIMKYDKIIVLDQGNIVQVETPLNLLQIEGLFQTLVMQQGKKFQEEMIKLAQQKNLNQNIS